MNTKKTATLLATAIALAGAPAQAQHTQSHDTTKAAAQHEPTHHITPAYVLGAGIGPLLENPRVHNAAAMLYARTPLNEKTYLEAEGAAERGEETTWHAGVTAFRSLNNGWFAMAGVRGGQTHATTVQPFIGIAKEHGPLEFALMAGPATEYTSEHGHHEQATTMIVSPEVRFHNRQSIPVVALRGWTTTEGKPGIEARVLGPAVQLGTKSLGAYVTGELERVGHETAKGAAVGLYLRF